MPDPSRLAALAQNRYWSALEAREVLDLADASGLDLPDFAERHGFKLDRLKRWQKRLSRGPAQPKLLKVELRPSEETPSLEHPNPSRVQIMLDNGAWLEVPAAFPIAHLRLLLEALREC